jgi:acetoacetyl-CoA reductase/3-oxoacyl-[acyl-carrier protein] reductase
MLEQFKHFMESSDKVILVIGAGHPHNVGGGIAEVLKLKGHTVYTGDVKYQQVEDITIDEAHRLTVDTLDYDSLVAAMELIVSKEGRLDALVNSAGINLLGALEDYPEDFWDKTIDLNLKAPMLAAKAFTNVTAKIGGQRTIINIGSNTAYVPRTRTFAYGASKSGLLHLTKCLARELAPQQIAVIVFDIGIMDGTPMHRKTHADLLEQRGWDEERTNKERLANVPLKRYSNPIEAGIWVDFLVRHGEYATGNSIRIDGAEK